MKRIYPYIAGFFVLLACATALALAVRGFLGNPSIETLITGEVWRGQGPLELSPERGRFALLYSIVEDKSLQFSVSVARLALPDLAINPAGEYVSLFIPGVSYLAIPGYLIGKHLGASQVGAYATIAVFALLNIFLIYYIARKLGSNRPAAWLGGIAFAFATPAFAYAANLYQHHISTFLILVAVAALLRWNDWRGVIVAWLSCGLGIVVDSPNLFLLFPVGVYALTRFISIEQVKAGARLVFKPLYLFTFVFLIIPATLLLAYNQASHGDPFKLPGTLQGVPDIGPDGKPARSQLSVTLNVVDKGTSTDKSAINFFRSRNLLNGFYLHVFSPDRGVVRFAPVILLGLLGLWLVLRKRPAVGRVLLATAGVTLLLYSLWGDPWGGWAFGSRYLIPAYAMLGIGLAVALSERARWQYIFLALFVILFTYSAGVGTLGAITSSANPPKVEVLNLEKLSGQVQKYTPERNWDFLHGSIGSKSFVYQAWAKQRGITAPEYYYSLLGLVLTTGTALTGWLLAEKLLARKKKSRV